MNEIGPRQQEIRMQLTQSAAVQRRAAESCDKAALIACDQARCRGR